MSEEIRNLVDDYREFNRLLEFLFNERSRETSYYKGSVSIVTTIKDETSGSTLFHFSKTFPEIEYEG